jgi:DNA polymerase-3 subunit delta'
MRDIQRELSLRPYEAPRKACIVEPADRMNPNSANSFLKTLEEPPGNAIIILITENADLLLPTIRSRCQVVRFAPLSPEHVRLLLERNGMASETAALLSQLADGSMRRALELDNDSLAGRREMLVKHLINLNLDRIATVFEASEELSGNRDETLEILDLLLSFARDMVHMAAGCGDIINLPIRQFLEELVSHMNLRRSLQLADDILETRRSVQRNANAKLALDQLFMKIAGATTA